MHMHVPWASFHPRSKASLYLPKCAQTQGWTSVSSLPPFKSGPGCSPQLIQHLRMFAQVVLPLHGPDVVPAGSMALGWFLSSCPGQETQALRARVLKAPIYLWPAGKLLQGARYLGPVSVMGPRHEECALHDEEYNTRTLPRVSHLTASAQRGG